MSNYRAIARLASTGGYDVTITGENFSAVFYAADNPTLISDAKNHVSTMTGEPVGSMGLTLSYDMGTPDYTPKPDGGA